MNAGTLRMSQRAESCVAPAGLLNGQTLTQVLQSIQLQVEFMGIDEMGMHGADARQIGAQKTRGLLDDPGICQSGRSMEELPEPSVRLSA